MKTPRFGFLVLTLTLGAGVAADEPVQEDCTKNHYILTQPACLEPAAKAGIGEPGALAVGRDGAIYFTLPSAVFKVGVDGILARVAGTGLPGDSGDGGPARGASLNFPEMIWHDRFFESDFAGPRGSLALDADGNLHIADYLNGRIRKVDAKGTITTVARFRGAAELAFDAAGNLVVGDSNWLRKIAPDGREIYLPSGGAWHASDPLAVNNRGDIFMARGDMVQKVSPTGFNTRLAGCPGWFIPSRCTLEDGVPAIRASLFTQGVATDSNGNVFVADEGHQCIRKVDAEGIIHTIAGSCTDEWEGGGFSGDGGPALEALFRRPTRLALGPDESLYVLDSGNRRIRRIDPDGIVTTVAGNGEWTFAPDLLPVLEMPSEVAAGSTLHVRVRTINSGPAPAEPTAAVILLWPSTFSQPEQTLAELAVPALLAGAEDAQDLALAIARDLPPGTYWVAVQANFDNSVAESRQANNLGAWALTVTAPAP